MSDSLENIAMEIISFAGDAKADGYSALHTAKKGDFEEASKMLELAESKIVKSHQIHLKLLGIDSKFNSINEQLLVSHAMDTLMTTASELSLIKELVDILKEKAR
ncbi:MAG: PTS lactose/cellobiose transporter subunit IIA [Bacillota bacterium]|jgi:PTS system cellobiose-specific IIA component